MTAPKEGAMKTLALLLALITSASAKTSTLAVSEFLDGQGNTGLVSLVRQPYPDGTTRTQIYYTFCYETEAASCLEGTGFIPNSAFKGSISTNYNTPNTLTVYVDTSTIPGFDNHLCLAPNYETDTCDGGEVPATGGLIAVTFTKTNVYWEASTTSDKVRRNGAPDTTTTTGTYSASADMEGTVVGVKVKPVLVTTTLILENSTSAQFSAAVVQKMNSLVGKRAARALLGD
jgi:hypothetical protein